MFLEVKGSDIAPVIAGAGFAAIDIQCEIIVSGQVEQSFRDFPVTGDMEMSSEETFTGRHVNAAVRVGMPYPLTTYFIASRTMS